MRRNFLNYSLSIFNRRAFYTSIFLFLTATLAFLLLSIGSETAKKVSAQESFDAPPTKKAARPDMLAIAFDLRSASDFTVYAGKGIKENGASQVKGKMFDAVRETENAPRVKEDLKRAFAAIVQLPCQDLQTQLAGGTFQPGVYCASSARLAEEMVLDGNNNEQGIFVFRISGSLAAKRDLKMSLTNAARAENVFFVTNDAANVDAETVFQGNILAKNSVEIGARAAIKGKILSLDGEVKLAENQIGGGTGILQICKKTPPNEPTTGAGNLSNRIFRFRIGASIYEVKTGQCSTPIDLPTGNIVIEELTDGRFSNQSGTWINRFKLLDVNSPTPGALGTVNLPLRTANVFIREGDVSNQTVVNFVNTFAVMATVEICKRPVAPITNPPQIIDTDVTGFFDYTIDATLNVVYTIPAGQCSGPIQVNVPSLPGPTAQPAIVRVTELAEAGFTLESATAFPADRFISLTLNKGISNSNGTAEFDNPRGGYVTAGVLEGGMTTQTTVNFFNRTNPGRIKVCKVAGPGIPLGTRFKFTVSGLAPAYEGTTPPSNPNAILPGVPVSREVVVVAGPAEQGGFCSFAEGTFIIGSEVSVNEELPPLDPVDTSNGGDIRVSKISVGAPSSAIKLNLAKRSVTFKARREVVEVEYVNYVFRPTLLKICKIAGPGVQVGTPFTFDVVINNENGLFPGLTVPPVVVPAGPASQGGNCVFAQGPYTPISSVGTFRAGSRVQVTERTITGFTSITSSTGTLSNCSPANSRCTSMMLGFPGGFNEVTFTNAATSCSFLTSSNSEYPKVKTSESIAAPECSILLRIPPDFDGDIKSDISVFRNGSWIWMKSSNGQVISVDFGFPTDKIVPADYEGDRKTDVAVYRDGSWHILRSYDNVYRAEQFGMADDIPQPGDYDGDGRDDLAVFRPSNGTWYISQSRDGFKAVQFGTLNDKPIHGDFDGDGVTDLAVFRPSEGICYILRSRDGFSAVRLGIASDKLVAADYDGDGKTDIAVFRDGFWYIQRSLTGFRGVQFGLGSDVPVPADYNGDGKADVAVFRDGTWHILLSGQTEDTYATAQLGAAGDFPVPAAYVR